MKLDRFRAQTLALKNGLLLGFFITLINCLVTFARLDLQTYTLISYSTILLIIVMASVTGYQRMMQTQRVPYAIQSSILTVCVGLVLGFGSLYFLTYSFMEILRTDPASVQRFRMSGEINFSNFMYRSIMQSITTSVPVSIITGILAGALGANIAHRVINAKS